MCIGCWIDYGSPTFVGPDGARLAAEAREFYPFGALHIVIEDWNLEDSNLESCLSESTITEAETTWLNAMKALPFGQRAAIMALADRLISPEEAQYAI